MYDLNCLIQQIPHTILKNLRTICVDYLIRQSTNCKFRTIMFVTKNKNTRTMIVLCKNWSRNIQRLQFCYCLTNMFNDQFISCIFSQPAIQFQFFRL